MSVRHEESRLLRRALVTNAAFSSACALVFLGGRGFVAQLVGVSSAVLAAFAAVLLAYAVHLAAAARRVTLQVGEARYFIAADLVYVMASAALLLGWPQLLTSAGRLSFAVMAGIVGLLAIVQILGYRRTFRARTA